jgi:hypothetical protein
MHQRSHLEHVVRVVVGAEPRRAIVGTHNAAAATLRAIATPSTHAAVVATRSKRRRAKPRVRDAFCRLKGKFSSKKILA